jgi:hypothetical protein
MSYEVVKTAGIAHNSSGTRLAPDWRLGRTRIDSRDRSFGTQGDCARASKLQEY